MHPASHGDNPPAHAPGNLNPGRKSAAARKAAAAAAGARAMLGSIPADLTPGPRPVEVRWTATASLLRDAADAEGYDFDAYGNGPTDGYVGRGMGYDRDEPEVPALTVRDYREAEVLAARAEAVLRVPVRVDNLGRGFIVYPTRLVA